MSKRSILVISNCQSDQVRHGLNFVFPEYDIAFKAAPNFKGGTDEIVNMLSKADTALVLSNFFSEVEKTVKENGINIELFRIPSLWFNAFHPDLKYVVNVCNGQYTEPNYNSAIVAWAYNNNVPEKKVESFFNAQIFSDLGYFSRWNQAVDNLKDEFESCGLDFYQWYLPVKRHGIFMYSINHPRQCALKEYVRVISSLIAKRSLDFNHDIYIPDSLWHTVWPVYPDIGKALGLPGNYIFTFQTPKKRLIFHTVSDYIHFSYNIYDSIGVDRHQLMLYKTDITLYDKVLGEWHERNA
jgi:hypothetical protein